MKNRKSIKPRKIEKKVSNDNNYNNYNDIGVSVYNDLFSKEYERSFEVKKNLENKASVLITFIGAASVYLTGIMSISLPIDNIYSLLQLIIFLISIFLVLCTAYFLFKVLENKDYMTVKVTDIRMTDYDEIKRVSSIRCTEAIRLAIIENNEINKIKQRQFTNALNSLKYLVFILIVFKLLLFNFI